MAGEQHGSGEDSRLLTDLEGNHEPTQEKGNQHTQHHRPTQNRYTSLALLACLLLNLALTAPLLLPHSAPPSPFAHLSRTRPEPYVLLTPFTSPNTTLSTLSWDSIDIDAGVVALPDSYAAAHSLPRAQRFPWDQSKGIYILHGFHNLHCVKIVHLSLDEFRTGRPQSRAWEHVLHCVDALRRQVLCDADDTPRATERRVEVVSGVGQHRVCRDWGRLEAWAREHTACYKRPERPGDERGVERFSHCPEGSGYRVYEGYVPTEEVREGLPKESVGEGHEGVGEGRREGGY